MIPAGFDYRRAQSAREAVHLLAANDNARLIAGGQSLLPMMKLRLAAPALLVDIGGIAELRGIRVDGDELVIGSMTTHAEIAASPEVQASLTALAEAAASIGDVQVRNLGTLGGSLAHADPAADYAAATLALGATVETTGSEGTRSIGVADLFAGLLTTTLASSEIITAIRFDRRGAAASAYEKFAQPASGYAVVGVAVFVERDAEGVCVAARAAATGISDRALRLAATESALSGTRLDDAALTAAAAAADAGIDDVRSDMYAAEDYRRHLLRVLVQRAARRASS
jgi:carbon-monoxide dehydrogenase medium subunit